ncbi:MAG: single-stranded DNA-binding protein [Lysobacteraceae bacterium]
MSIDALVSGRLAAAPKPGMSSNGNRYATARVWVATANAEERLSVSVIAFDEAVCSGLLALSTGDAVSLAGELTVKAWTDRDGNVRPSADLKAHSLLTPYHVRRKRNVMVGEADAQAESLRGREVF